MTRKIIKKGNKTQDIDDIQLQLNDQKKFDKSDEMVEFSCEEMEEFKEEMKTSDTLGNGNKHSQNIKVILPTIEG